jgi:hypothetical protein
MKFVDESHDPNSFVSTLPDIAVENVWNILFRLGVPLSKEKTDMAKHSIRARSTGSLPLSVSRHENNITVLHSRENLEERSVVHISSGEVSE